MQRSFQIGRSLKACGKDVTPGYFVNVECDKCVTTPRSPSNGGTGVLWYSVTVKYPLSGVRGNRLKYKYLQTLIPPPKLCFPLENPHCLCYNRRMMVMNRRGKHVV